MSAANEPVRHYPHADIWALGVIAFFSRLHWILSLYYYSDQHATASVIVTIFFSLLLVGIGYLIARFARQRVSAYLVRAALLAMFLFHLSVQLRQILAPGTRLELAWQLEIAAVGLVLAGLGAARLVAVWARLRAALLAVTVIGSTSVFALVGLLAPNVELLSDGQSRHRPVVVVLLDEFSAGSATAITRALTDRQLRVEWWSVASKGRDTIDAIPAIFTQRPIPGARACTSTAVCGRNSVVDFARISVARGDVDIVGLSHRYCAIKGLRYCVNVQFDIKAPVWKAFFCSLPARLILGEQIGCHRAGLAFEALDTSAVSLRELFRAPFWSQGGLLYTHILMPHPPSVSGEVRLADAYAANIERARKIVMSVVDHLERAPFREDFTLVIISDHHLRSDYWCKTEPYANNECDLPESMLTAGVPFIIATRGDPVAHAVPNSNTDLFPIVVELSRER